MQTPGWWRTFVDEALAAIGMSEPRRSKVADKLSPWLFFASVAVGLFLLFRAVTADTSVNCAPNYGNCMGIGFFSSQEIAPVPYSATTTLGWSDPAEGTTDTVQVDKAGTLTIMIPESSKDTAVLATNVVHHSFSGPEGYGDSYWTEYTQMYTFNDWVASSSSQIIPLGDERFLVSWVGWSPGSWTFDIAQQ